MQDIHIHLSDFLQDGSMDSIRQKSDSMQKHCTSANMNREIIHWQLDIANMNKHVSFHRQSSMLMIRHNHKTAWCLSETFCEQPQLMNKQWEVRFCIPPTGNERGIMSCNDMSAVKTRLKTSPTSRGNRTNLCWWNSERSNWKTNASSKFKKSGLAARCADTIRKDIIYSVEYRWLARSLTSVPLLPAAASDHPEMIFIALELRVGSLVLQRDL